MRDLPQTRDRTRVAGEDRESLGGGAGGGRCEAGVVDERTCGVDDLIDDGLRSQDGPALAAQRLGERRGDDNVAGVREPGCVNQAATLLTGDADAVCLVHQQDRIVRRADRGQLRQRRSIAEHRVDRLDDDDGARL